MIPLGFDVDNRVTDNIIERFEIANVQIPDPLYLESIQLMQLAAYESKLDYWFYMDVDDIRLVDAQQE